MNIYIVENNKIVGTNIYSDIDDRDCIVVDGVRSELEDIDQANGVYYYEKINDDESITKQDEFPNNVTFPDLPKIE